MDPSLRHACFSTTKLDEIGPDFGYLRVGRSWTQKLGQVVGWEWFSERCLIFTYHCYKHVFFFLRVYFELFWHILILLVNMFCLFRCGHTYVLIHIYTNMFVYKYMYMYAFFAYNKHTCFFCWHLWCSLQLLVVKMIFWNHRLTVLWLRWHGQSTWLTGLPSPKARWPIYFYPGVSTEISI